jgi:indolepyruvate ferredoxin oxidoreductase alpha subunit
MLEPADSQEAKDYIKIAFDLSEKFDTPVFLRTTTRVSHSKSIVALEEPSVTEDRTAIRFNTSKYVMVPINARARRIEVEKRLQKLKEFSENFSENKIEMNDPEVGIITSGMPYNYAKDLFPNCSYLKLGMVYPIPSKLIRKFASKVKKLYVIEELDPFIEEQVAVLGIKVIGKEIFPYTNEFDPGVIEQALKGKKTATVTLPNLSIPPRPPNLCPGCPHRGLFYVLGKLKAFVTGDIGCYTLSYMKPLEGLHSCVCMGASIGMAHGMSKALKDKGKGKVVGVIGDSTFIHSGITPLLNMAYNKSDAVIVICDNRTTAMTGMQEHPATGYTLQGEKTKELDFTTLANALGIDSVRVIDPYDIKATKKVMHEELSKPGPSFVISRRSCVLFKRNIYDVQKQLEVDTNICIGCKSCIDLGCPPISWIKFEDIPSDKIKKNAKKQEGIAFIDRDLCNGCTLCQQVCKVAAIVEVD